MVDFSEMLVGMEKFVHAKEAYDAHGPPSTIVAPPAPVVKEWPPPLEF